MSLLHVFQEFPLTLAEKLGSQKVPDFPAARMKLRVDASKLLSQIAKRLRAADFRVSQMVKEGDPRKVILDFAERWPADLIVLGSRGRTGLRRILMGSVAETVARYARCSVEIVRISGQPE